MADLLLELFSEEIPARMQEDALNALSQAIFSGLLKNTPPPAEIKADQYKLFVTPRRIGIWVKNLHAVQPDINTELKGPKVGAPQQAIDGFLKKSGMKLEQLTQQDGMYVAKIHQKGKPTAEVLKTVIEDILKSFPWPKSMRWGAHEVIWVRPLHSILCIFDGKVVPVEFGPIKAGNITHGHRFLSPKAITIKSVSDYEAALEKAHVIADREKRKAEIKKQAEALAAKHGFTVKADEGLLDEVTGLVEWPVLLMGSIDAKFMDLPQEVLTTVMKKHQKYLALTTKDGKLADKFLIVSNMAANDGGKAIVAGNERVARARFSDARFFWDQDRKKSLDEWTKGLKDVTFHAKLGTVADKVERVKTLALQLADYTKADKKLVERAALLCKADLVTGMVGEFAELQGIMGRYYALAQKEDAAVADAIRDHYKPQGPNDSVPNNPVAACVALADKLDTLISMFAIGEKPTGSKDPFALRRAALGVIRIILENNIRISLNKFVNKELLAFFHDRLIVQMKDSGIRHDVIKAVVAGGDDDLVRIRKFANELQFLILSEQGPKLLSVYNRAHNIVNAEEKKDKCSYNKPVNIDLLETQEEKNLYKGIQNLASVTNIAFKEEKFDQLMEITDSIRPLIEAFFDKIMVNDSSKPEIRVNRLCLLSELTRTLNNVADFNMIEGDSKEQKKAA